MSEIVGRKVGFGVALTAAVGSQDTALDGLVNNARLAEDLGFDLVTISDHAHSQQPTFEAWTALCVVAARTTRINVAPVVLGLPYRHPAVLAKMSETLDRLSGGRLVLGLGAGGYDDEFAAFGLPVRTPREKLLALREAVHILRDLWTEPSLTHAGSEFALDDARIEPKAAHRIPVWLGTYGERALALTGQLADGWIPSLPRLGLARAVNMRREVRAAAKAAGRDPDSVTCSCNVVVRIGGGVPSPAFHAVHGDADGVTTQLMEIMRSGFTFPVCHLSTPQQLELFATKVIPRISAELD